MSHLRLVPDGAAAVVSPATSDRSRPLRLGLLTPHNPFDATAFSGTASRAFAALSQSPGIELRLLGPHRPPSRLSRLARRAGRLPAKTFDLSPSALCGLDGIVGLVASELLDRLPPDAPPFLHITDATPQVLLEDYGYDIPQGVIAREVRIASRAAEVIYSSATMAARAPADLGLPGFRPSALPFGLNLAPTGKMPDRAPPGERIELLFVGLDWQRKGGDIALDALRHLRANGCDARLTLVGATPSAIAAEPGVEVAGFLNKNRPKDAARLSTLYARAHLLILPTRGDCTPMVLGEAMTHGTPVLASDIGGIAESIGQDGAGGTLPSGAQGRDWARRIGEMTRDATVWRFLSDAARDRAGARFSWTAWASGVEATARRVSTGRVLREAV